MNVRKTAPKLAIGQLVWKAGALSHEKMDQAKKPLAQQGPSARVQNLLAAFALHQNDHATKIFAWRSLGC